MQTLIIIINLALLLPLGNANQDELLLLSSDYPFTSRIYSVGKSTKSDILAIQINSNPKQNRQCLQPMVKFVANSRGFDSKASDLLVDFASHLLTGYEKNDRHIVDLIDNYDIHIVPSMNPDVELNHLNRGFPVWNNKQMTHDELFENRSQRTKTLMTWIMEKPFALSVNVLESARDDDRSMQDFHHFYTSGEEVKVHMSEVKSDRESVFNANKDQLMSQFDRMLTGIKGYILDRHADFASSARLMFENNDKPVYTTNNCGEFWHFMEPGEYSVTAWGTDNYQSEPMKVRIEKGKILRVDFILDQFPVKTNKNNVILELYPSPEFYQSASSRSSQICACSRVTVGATTEPNPESRNLNPEFSCPPPPGTRKNRIIHQYTFPAGRPPIRIISPNNPMAYPDLANNRAYECRYIICHEDVSKKLEIKAPLGTFNIQNTTGGCSADVVNVNGGTNIRGEKVKRAFCGNRLNTFFGTTSFDNCITMNFATNNDGITNAPGFKFVISEAM